MKGVCEVHRQQAQLTRPATPSLLYLGNVCHHVDKSGEDHPLFHLHKVVVVRPPLVADQPNFSGPVLLDFDYANEL